MPLYIVFAPGENFIPPILKSKFRNSLQFSINKIDNKLWMKYLEKKLEDINLSLGKKMRINCLLEYYERNIRHIFSEEFPTNCIQTNLNELDDLQVNIYGEICGLSSRGKIQKLANDDSCLRLPSLEKQTYCSYLLGKYSLPLFI